MEDEILSGYYLVGDISVPSHVVWIGLFFGFIIGYIVGRAWEAAQQGKNVNQQKSPLPFSKKEDTPK